MGRQLTELVALPGQASRLYEVLVAETGLGGRWPILMDDMFAAGSKFEDMHKID